MAEQTFWQRCLSRFSFGQNEVTVPLPVEKLKCSVSARHVDDYKPAVLVSCGSFNPPTNMHLRMFELARDHLVHAGYDVWGGYLSPVNNAYEKQGLASSTDRIAMSQAAVEASDLIMVDSWEACQPEYQNSLHVLKNIEERLDQAMHADSSSTTEHTKMPVRTMLLCGSDLLESFLKPGVWKPEHVKSIFKEHGVVCISRKLSSLQSELEKSKELQQYQDRLIWVEEPVPNEISSSKLRESIQQGKSAKYLTPDSVLRYVKEHNLYGSATGDQRP